MPLALLLGSVRRRDLRAPSGPRSCSGQRPGPALLDRQVQRRAAVPAGGGEHQARGEVVHRYRGLAPGRWAGGDQPAAGRHLGRPVAPPGELGEHGFILGWIAVALVARREYVDTLRESIQHHRLDAERASAPVLDRSATEMLVDRLEATDPEEILYALGLLEMGRRQAAHPAVRGLLDHPSPEVRQKAIAMLNAAGDRTVRGRVEALLRDPHLEVRTEALLYLSRHAPPRSPHPHRGAGRFRRLLDQAALVAYLAHPGPAQNLRGGGVAAGEDGQRVGARSPTRRMEAARLVGFGAVPGVRPRSRDRQQLRRSDRSTPIRRWPPKPCGPPESCAIGGSSSPCSTASASRR